MTSCRLARSCGLHATVEQDKHRIADRQHENECPCATGGARRERAAHSVVGVELPKVGACHAFMLCGAAKHSLCVPGTSQCINPAHCSQLEVFRRGIVIQVADSA
jgi:hypothetical protein